MKKIANIFSIIMMLVFLNGFMAFAESDTPQGMFDLYEQNRDKGIPNYITEDFILLAYSMILNETVTDIEETLLYPELKTLTDSLIKKLTPVNPEDKVAGANLDYLNLLASLLSGDSSDKKAVADELKKIREGEGIAASEMMQQQIDYTQFKVRGKYPGVKIYPGIFRR